MKKYSQFITFANCTTSNATLQLANNNNTSSSVQPAVLSNTISHTNSNANRILVEKQLASLSTNGTPKSVKQSVVAKNGNSIMNNAKNCTKQHTSSNDVNNENNNHDHVSTPHTKNTITVNKVSTHKTPKALFFDEIKVNFRIYNK